MQSNAQKFKKNKTTIICKDVFVALKAFIKSGKQFDIIYVDPPYEAGKNFEKGSTSYSYQVLRLVNDHALLCSRRASFY